MFCVPRNGLIRFGEFEEFPIVCFFFKQLVQEVCVERRWGQKGGPWEFNLRDMFRWCELMQADQSPGFYNPGQHVALVYADRMRTETDKAQVCWKSLFIHSGGCNQNRHLSLRLAAVSVRTWLTNSVFLQVLSVFRKVFGEDFEPYNGSRQFHITPLNLQVFVQVYLFLVFVVSKTPL